MTTSAIDERFIESLKKEVLKNPNLSPAKFFELYPKIKFTQFTFYRYKRRILEAAGRLDEWIKGAKEPNDSKSSRPVAEEKVSRSYNRKVRTLYQSVWDIDIAEFNRSPFEALESFLLSLTSRTRLSYEIIKIEKRIEDRWVPHYEVRES